MNKSEAPRGKKTSLRQPLEEADLVWVTSDNVIINYYTSTVVYYLKSNCTVCWKNVQYEYMLKKKPGTNIGNSVILQWQFLGTNLQHPEKNPEYKCHVTNTSGNQTSCHNVWCQNILSFLSLIVASWHLHINMLFTLHALYKNHYKNAQINISLWLHIKCLLFTFVQFLINKFWITRFFFGSYWKIPKTTNLDI